MAKHLANILTGCRILGSILLLVFPAFSVAFYITYLFCGLSDMIDGTIARKTNSTSKFGSQLDTSADLVFVVASSFKVLPAIHIPGWLWIWGGVIAVIKISNIIWGYVSKKQFISLHTIMNKVTGLLLFLLPLTIPFAELNYVSPLHCLRNALLLQVFTVIGVVGHVETVLGNINRFDLRAFPECLCKLLAQLVACFYLHTKVIE